MALILVSGGTAAAVMLNGQGSAGEASNVPETDVAAEPIAFPDDEPAAAAGAQPCTTVTVLSSLENSEMVSRLVDGYNAQARDVDGSCVTVVATKDKSGPCRRGRDAQFLAPARGRAPDRVDPRCEFVDPVRARHRRGRERSCGGHEHRVFQYRARHAR